MSSLGDRVFDHLRDVIDLPDLSGTRYEMVGRLGAGGMGMVYAVRDRELDREVALKVLAPEAATDDLAARMVREARHLARLEHPNIVPVHDVGTLDDGRVYYAMKLVRGMRLDAWRAEAPPRPASLRIFLKVCDAVAFAHAHGVIHRDLKPENVMVGEFGEALVMDWGLSKAMEEGEQEAARSSALPSRRAAGAVGDAAGRGMGGAVMGTPRTEHGAVIGTPAYMAPEQARGEIALVDARSDIYALGALLAFLLLGERPPAGADRADRANGATDENGEGGTARLSAAGAPKPLAAVCARAMAADPRDRYPSVESLGADVARFLDGEPVSAHRESVLERAGRLLARNRTIVLLLGAYLLMRILALVFLRR